MIEIVINIIECLMLSYFLFSLMDIKENKKILYFISLFITSVTIITLSNYISMYDIFLTSVIILSNILVSYFFVNNDISEIVFYACLESLLSAASNALAAMFFSQRALLIIGSKSLYLLFAIITIRFLRKKQIVLDYRVNIILSLIMCALQIFISHFMQLYVFFFNDYSELRLTFLFLFMSFVGIMYMIIYMFDLYQLKQEYDKLKSVQDSHNIITNLYNEVKITKHDVKHVYEMFNYYLENEEYDKLSEYVNTKQEEITNIPTLIQSKHELLNMILNTKIVKAYSHNIQVECEISVLDNIFIKDYDLNELLSNTLDNAIENNIENGYIRIKIIQDNNYIYITVINSTNNKDIKTKKNQNNHGFGLKSIKKICNKYKGDMEVSFEKDEFQLKMTLIA